MGRGDGVNKGRQFRGIGAQQAEIFINGLHTDADQSLIKACFDQPVFALEVDARFPVSQIYQNSILRLGQFYDGFTRIIHLQLNLSTCSKNKTNTIYKI